MLRPGANRDPDIEIWIPRSDTPGRLLARRWYNPHDGAWGRVIQHTYETTAELRVAFAAFARDCDPDDPRSEIWWPVPRRLQRFRIRGCSRSAPTLAEPVSGFYGPKISGGSGKIGDLPALRPFSAWSTQTPSEAS